MIDPEKLRVANNRLDAQFSADHKDFLVWWHKHPDSNYHPDHLQYLVPARVAYKVQRYRDEFLEGKQTGLNEI